MAILYYYEFGDYVVSKGYYPSKHCVSAGSPRNSASSMADWQIANRVWCEDDNGSITWGKNRQQGIHTPVDLDEFFWIKMKSVRI